MNATAAPPRSGVCVHCHHHVTLTQVSTETDGTPRYQWVPDGAAARPGRNCRAGSMPAYHWAADAEAAVY